MFKLLSALLFLILLNSCTSPIFESSLPVVSKLNLEAELQLDSLKNRPAYATKALRATGVAVAGELQLKGVRVEKVFKQNKLTMLVAYVTFKTLGQPIHTKVIFPYEEGRGVFKELVLKMMSFKHEAQYTVGTF